SRDARAGMNDIRGVTHRNTYDEPQIAVDLRAEFGFILSNKRSGRKKRKRNGEERNPEAVLHWLPDGTQPVPLLWMPRPKSRMSGSTSPRAGPLCSEQSYPDVQYFKDYLKW